MREGELVPPEVKKEAEKMEVKLSREDREKLLKAVVDESRLRTKGNEKIRRAEGRFLPGGLRGSVGNRENYEEGVKMVKLARAMWEYDKAYPKEVKEMMQKRVKELTEEREKREALIEELSEKEELSLEDAEKFIEVTDIPWAAESRDPELLGKLDEFKNKNPEEYEKMTKERFERHREEMKAEEEWLKGLMEKVAK